MFDCVVGLDLLCHLDEPGKALAEFHRVLKDGGMLILDSTNSKPLWAFFYPRYMGKNPLIWARIVKYHGVYPGWQDLVSHYTRKEFVSMLKDAGFGIEKSIDYGPWICPKWHLMVSKKIPGMN
jgi:ubiquinone/menaquinone biosynthesis C-methylase UbiE